MQVIAWAVRQKQGSQSAGCEIFSVTAEKQCESPGTALSVKTVELLQVCSGEFLNSLTQIRDATRHAAVMICCRFAQAQVHGSLTYSQQSSYTVFLAEQPSA